MIDLRTALACLNSAEKVLEVYERKGSISFAGVDWSFSRTSYDQADRELRAIISQADEMRTMLAKLRARDEEKIHGPVNAAREKREEDAREDARGEAEDRYADREED